jgi:hypothetical protein
MAFVVKSVSRGDILFTDGSRTARVLGEALIPASKQAPSFVVYMDSLKVDGGEISHMNESNKAAIKKAIEDYFSERGMSALFE